MRTLLIGIGFLSACLVAGCPQNAGVTALIGISSTQGDAPLTISLSATGSTAVNGPLTYSWDLGDGSTSSAAEVIHTYDNPGRYLVILRVTDANGVTDSDSQEVRVRGTGVVAAISADVTSGAAPLLVTFDGTGSSAPDDSIYSYAWDFGDGTTSGLAQPQKVYAQAGTFTVTLTVTTDGGLEGTTSATIRVVTSTASLQFDGVSFANLPTSSTGAAVALEDFTIEAWVKSENEGGNLFSIGSGALALEIEPSNNALRILVNGIPVNATASSLAGTWRHIAVVYSFNATTATVYLDGQSLVSTNVSSAINATAITLGNGYRGKLADIRLWEDVRTSDEIAGSMNTRLSGAESNLLGYWMLDEGSGQTLGNDGDSGADGTLGSSAAAESADPAWSTDGPGL